MGRDTGRDGLHRHRVGTAARTAQPSGPRRLDRERARRLHDDWSASDQGTAGERRALARRLCGLALLLISDGDPEVAAAACHESVALLRQLDERTMGVEAGATTRAGRAAGSDAAGTTDSAAGVGAADPLSPREREVVDLVGRGLPNGRIAEELFISKRTVESHVEHVKRKLGYESRTEVMAWAMRRAVDPPE